MNFSFDQHNMRADLADYPTQISYTLHELENFQLSTFHLKPTNIIFCGMGGSAIGGDIVRSLVADQLQIPMLLVRNYTLPKFVNKNSLVIACSFSGNTEETITCFQQAQKLHIPLLGMSSGGTLEKLAKKSKTPFFQLSYQSQCGQPRVNSGVMITAILGILQKLQLITIPTSHFEKATSLVKKCQKQWHAATASLPYTLATSLQHTFPLIHGTDFTTPLAFRWKQDFNETGKHCAFWDISPECNHNSVVGYQFPPALSKYLTMLTLESSYDHPRNKLRWSILKEIWRRRKIEYHAIQALGTTKLEQIFYLTYLAMHTSFYLGLLHQIDPTPVDIIKFVKATLKKK